MPDHPQSFKLWPLEPRAGNLVLDQIRKPCRVCCTGSLQRRTRTYAKSFSGSSARLIE